ncbi:hypothetical protein [Streptomyces sp. cmx-10-25]|uniref:hypothetical protein n=1 Tax=Streptomyces sp. cmx-10-25 TaxID=2790919 RepID=UPI0039803C58
MTTLDTPGTADRSAPVPLEADAERQRTLDRPEARMEALQHSTRTRRPSPRFELWQHELRETREFWFRIVGGPDDQDQDLTPIPVERS